MDDAQQLSSVRINLFVSLDTSIQIEKESEKRGVQRTQFIKEAIYEKLRKVDFNNTKEDEISLIKGEIKEIKYLLLATLDKMQKKE